MRTLPNTPREWARRTGDRMTPLLWALVVIEVAAVVCVAYAIGSIE